MESTPEGLGTLTHSFTKLEFFNEIRNILKDDVTVIHAKTEQFLSDKQASAYFLSDDEKRIISDLVFKLRTRWNASNRTEENFKNKNHDWLQKSVELKKNIKSTDLEKTKTDAKKPKAGRPQLSFAESSARSKRRRTEDLRATTSTEELLYSVTSKLRSEGKTDFAKVVHDISQGSPTKATKYIKSVDFVNTNLPFTNDEALSLFIELGLSQSKYQQLRDTHLQKKSKMLPSYKKLRTAKLQCYPASGLTNTANEAEVELKPLLDHTIERIIRYRMEVMKTLSEIKLANLTLIGKWGCDGSSGHSEYKQRVDENSTSDESIFFTSYVPLQLVHVDTVTTETTVIWKNVRPSSPRFCRPIKIECAKESLDLTKKNSGLCRTANKEFKSV